MCSKWSPTGLFLVDQHKPQKRGYRPSYLPQESSIPDDSDEDYGQPDREPPPEERVYKPLSLWTSSESEKDLTVQTSRDQTIVGPKDCESSSVDPSRMQGMQSAQGREDITSDFKRPWHREREEGHSSRGSSEGSAGRHRHAVQKKLDKASRVMQDAVNRELRDLNVDSDSSVRAY